MPPVRPQRPTRSWRPLALLIGLVSAPTLAEEVSASRPAPAEPLAECLDISKSGRTEATEDEFNLMRNEYIGPLSNGLGEEHVMAALSCPVTKGEEEFWHATADYHQEWSFPACGISLDMVSVTEGDPKVVDHIVAVAPSTLATSTGIRIGSTEEEVLAAYGSLLDCDWTEPGKTIVAGSIYGGLIVSITEGRVNRMFLGAAAY